MHVSVIRMPRRVNASTARRSSSSTQPGCFSTEALAKSVPRGSMIVGTRTAAPSPASASTHSTPALPRLSVSAMTCAWVTGTNSAAPKKSPTLIWCSIARCTARPRLPACMARSNSFSLI
jgi:hypothetical protein